MATKFSDFTAQAATSTTFVVGYDGTTNTQYSQTQLTDFVFDGALSGNTTLSMGNHNIAFNSTAAANSSGNFTFNGTYTSTAGGVGVAGGGFLIGGGYGTRLKPTYLQIYSGAVLQGTSSGFLTIHNTVSNNAAYSINARLGIVGKHNDNTSYALRVQNSDSDELMQVRNDGAIAIGKGATLPVGVTSTVIGTSASANGNGTGIGNYATASGGGSTVLGSYSSAAGSYSIAIGYDADVSAVSNSIAIGANANVGATNSINIDASGNNASSNNDAGTLKVHLTSNTTPSFQVDAANGMTPPTFSSNPSSPSAGNVIYNTSDNKLKFYNGSAWQDAAGGDTLYTADGTINEDRVITVGHDATTKASYTTTFESTKTTSASGNTRNTALGNRLILTETVTSAPTGYSSNRGAGISLTHNSDGDDVTGTINVQSINSGSSDYYGRSQMGFRTNTGFVFSQEGTAPSNWSGDIFIFRDRSGSNQSKSLRYDLGSDGGRLRLVAPNAKTSQILLATPNNNTFYRYISGDNNGALTLGRKLTSGSEEAYITCNGIGGGSGAIAIGVNQGTPAATLHVTGSGATSSTTSFLVENSSGHDILKATDDGDFTISTAAKLSVNFSGLYNAIYYKNSVGTQIGAFGIHSASSGLFDVRSSGNNRVRISADSGIVVDLASGNDWDSKACLTLNSTTQGMLPPRMTNTQRDAISSPTTGLTLYSTTDNKLQFYNGSAWTDAGGGGDTIYTADGTLSGNRTITVPGGGSITFSYPSVGYFYVGSSTISSHGQFQAPAGGRFQINSYSTVLKQNHLLLYATTYITGTTTGFVTVSGTTGTAHSINARLGVIGKSTTSTTDYAFRVQQSDNTDLFTLRDDGAFALGKSASTTDSTQIAIGSSAGVSAAHGIAIGSSSSAGSNGVSIGQSSLSAIGGIAIGYDSGSSTNNCINIGSTAAGTGANSITLNVTGLSAAPNTAKEFGVYMSDASTPDFRILHDGNSYITGTGNFGVGTTNPTDRIQTKTSIGVIGDGVNAGKLKLYCEAGSAHHVAIEGPAHTGAQGDYTIKLPNTAPSAGQVLVSDASGNLSWKSPHELDFSNLPTSDPGVEGRLYNDEGTLKVSIP